MLSTGEPPEEPLQWPEIAVESAAANIVLTARFANPSTATMRVFDSVGASGLPSEGFPTYECVAEDRPRISEDASPCRATRRTGDGLTLLIDRPCVIGGSYVVLTVEQVDTAAPRVAFVSWNFRTSCS